MKQERIDRINELARKARLEELTDDEKREQKTLREEYVAAYRNNLETILDHTVIMDEEGRKTKLKKKDPHR